MLDEQAKSTHESGNSDLDAALARIAELEELTAQSTAADARDEALLALLPAGVITLDIKGFVTFCNDAFYDLTGFGPDEIIGRHLTQIGTLRVRDIPHHAKTFGRILAGGACPIYPFVYRYKAGALKEAEARTSVLRSNGRITGVIAIVEDVSTRKQANRELALSNARWRSLVMDSPDHILTLDRELRIETVNRPSPGLTTDDLLGVPLYHFVGEHDQSRVRATLERVLETGNAATYETRFLAPDGRIFYETRAVPRVLDGETVGLMTISRDVTAQRRAQNALRQREADLAMAQRVAHIGSWTFDPVTQQPTWTDEMFRIFGLEPAVVAPPYSVHKDLIHPDDWERFDTAVRIATTQGIGYDMDVRVVRPDGETRSLRAQCVAETDSEGTVTRLVGTTQDITDVLAAEEREAELEKRLQQAHRLEALGQLAGGIAHDFNNLLTVINGYSGMILDQPDLDDEIREELGQIRDAGQRAAELTRQLLTFSRRQTPAMRSLTIDSLLSDLSRMLRRLIGEDIELTLDLDGGTGVVHADPGQIEQVVVNLAVNARDAMPNGGILTIRTREELDKSQLAADERRSGERCLHISVTDTGTGMTSDVLEHLFEPFFTTKEVGQGTGLGLATVWAIVKDSDGQILVESEKGAGSTFHIRLPLHDPADTVPVGPETVTSKRGSETILIAEDQADVRRIAVRLLESEGYTVLEATNGYEALGIWRTHNEPIDLLLTDVVMPRMGGRELVAELRKARRPCRVVYMSGYPRDGRRGVTPEALDAPLISKPFSKDSLLVTVRRVLDAVPEVHLDH